MKNVFLVNGKRNYFYKVEPECIFPYRFKKLSSRTIEKVLKHLGYKRLPDFFLNRALFDASKIIFTDSALNFYLYDTLLNYVKEENVYLYYMNLINPSSEWFRYKFPNRCYSFDQEDAIRYGIGYRHLPYTSNIHLPVEPIEYDTVLLAREKGRLKEVNKAVQAFEKCGLCAKVMLLDCTDAVYKINKYMSYGDYLKYVAKSRSILELNMEGQSSCTYRFLESLFLEKKLVTNNIFIKEDPYYDPENVFILGIDHLSELSDFIHQPYKKNHLDLRDLTFENWIRNW